MILMDFFYQAAQAQFQAPKPPKIVTPPKPRAPPAPRGRGRGAGRGRPPKPPKRDWGGDDDEEVPDIPSSSRGRGRGMGGYGGRRSGHSVRSLMVRLHLLKRIKVCNKSVFNNL